MQKIPNYQTKEYLIQEWITNKKSQRQIAEENKVSIITIEKWIKRNGLCFAIPKSRLQCNNELMHLDNPVFLHLLGFICADGYIREQDQLVEISISSLDIDLLNSYIEHLKLPITVKHYKYGKTDKASVFIFSKTLVKTLLEIGVPAKNKTFDLAFPTLNSEFQYKWFLRGFFEGDGNFRKEGFRITCASEKFINELITYLNSHQSAILWKTFQNGLKDKVYYKLEVSTKKAKELLKWVYDLENDFGLGRKIRFLKVFLK